MTDWVIGWDPIPPDKVAALATRGAVTAVVRLALIQGGAFVTLLLIGQQASPAAFGVYGVTYGVIMLALRVVVSGFQGLLSREPGTLAAADLANATRALFVVCGIMAATLIVSAAVFSEIRWLLVACAAFALSFPFRLPALVLLSRGVQIGRLAWIQAVDTLGFQLVTLALLVYGTSMETALAVALAAVALFAPVLCVSLAPWPPVVRAPIAMANVTKAGLPYYGYSIVFNVRELGLLPLVGVLAGAAVAGQFTWALAFAIIPQVVTLAVVEILYSPLAFLAGAGERFDQAALFVIRTALTLSCTIAAMVGAGLSTFLATVAGSQWGDTRTLTWVLLAATVISAMEYVLSTVCMAEGRVEAVTRVRIGEIGATVVAAVITLQGNGSATIFALALVCVRLGALMWLWHAASRSWLNRISRAALAAVVGGVLGGLAGAAIGMLSTGIGPASLVVIGVTTLAVGAVAVRMIDGGQATRDALALWHVARSR